MLLGALIHLGAEADVVSSELRGLRPSAERAGIALGEFRLRVRTAGRQGVTGYNAAIEVAGGGHLHVAGGGHGATQAGGGYGGGARPHSDGHSSGGGHSHGHTPYLGIREAIDGADIGARAKRYAQAAYLAIAKAEAAAHGTTIDEVHFHEVGSPRTLYAIVASAIAAALVEERFGVVGFTCGAITDGSGTVECSHGIIPVPVPAVRELLKQTDIPLNSDPSINTEMVTPSGLGLLIGLGCRFGAEPEARSAQREGYGFGTRDTGLLGAVRAVLG
jgi:uncharacterized protein (DUF111 family)